MVNSISASSCKMCGKKKLIANKHSSNDRPPSINKPPRTNQPSPQHSQTPQQKIKTSPPPPRGNNFNPPMKISQPIQGILYFL